MSDGKSNRFNGPTMSSSSIGSYTGAHQKALAILNHLGVAFRAEEEFVRWNEYHGKGNMARLKTWRADILIIDSRYENFVLEIEGKGSNSSDNESRDHYFERHGLPVDHLPNREVNETEIMSILATHKKPYDEYS